MFVSTLPDKSKTLDERSSNTVSISCNANLTFELSVKVLPVNRPKLEAVVPITLCSVTTLALVFVCSTFVSKSWRACFTETLSVIVEPLNSPIFSLLPVPIMVVILLMEVSCVVVLLVKPDIEVVFVDTEPDIEVILVFIVDNELSINTKRLSNDTLFKFITPLTSNPFKTPTLVNDESSIEAPKLVSLNTETPLI